MNLYLMATSSADITAAAQEIPNTIFDLWKLLIFNNNVFFQAVAAPFKLIAAISFLYNAIPLLSMPARDLQQCAKPVIAMVFVLGLFLNNCNGMRQFGMLQYALAVGTANAIETSLQTVANTAAIANQFEGHSEAMKEIQKATDDCVGISPTLPAGGDNPAFLQCNADLKALVNSKIASGDIQGTTAQDRLNQALSAPDPFSMMAKLLQTADQFVNDAAMAIPRAILNGLTAATKMIGDLAMLISVISSPIFLSLSILNPKPLLAWFSTFWGAAIFMICNSIVVGLFAYIGGKVPASASLFGISIGMAILSPLLSGALAVGGGLAVYSACAQFATGMISSAGIIGRKG